MPQNDSRLSNKLIGFIGLGFMGKPMARNLHRAGAKMIVHNRSPEPVNELVSEGMASAKNPADVAEQSDIIILMLTDTAAVETVITGKGGLLQKLRANTLVIDMGTTLMTTTRELAKKIKASGGYYIDAPVSGGTHGAETGTLNIMAGGDNDVIKRARNIFEILGAKTSHVGEIGAGQVAKSVNQMIVGLTIGAIAEGFSLARKAGVDAARLLEALGGGWADSRVLEVHGKRMVDRNFKPGAKSTIQRKDMDQAIKLASSLGLQVPATTLNRDLYDSLIRAGYGDLDHAALIKAISPDII